MKDDDGVQWLLDHQRLANTKYQSSSQLDHQPPPPPQHSVQTTLSSYSLAHSPRPERVFTSHSQLVLTHPDIGTRIIRRLCFLLNLHYYLHFLHGLSTLLQ